ncbi:MAG: BCAM0308 family protein [Actinomycetota bacterium]|nr:BCAM0308 family protein [Actinomycetota bacterium]
MKICSKCVAVFDGQKWIYDEEEYLRLKKRGKVEAALCPGCDRLEKRRVDGVVHLKGKFLKEHREEALNLIKNVAEKKRRKNVAARIFELMEDDEGITVETTDHVLAERIGKEFEKAFSGKLEITWLKKEEFVRVNWVREE